MASAASTNSRRFGPASESLGIADLHFHDLRNEAVSRLVEGDLSDQEVASISGHKSIQMLRRYTHLRAEDLVAKLEKRLIQDCPATIRNAGVLPHQGMLL
jgi:integrase